MESPYKVTLQLRPGAAGFEGVATGAAVRSGTVELVPHAANTAASTMVAIFWTWFMKEG